MTVPGPEPDRSVLTPVVATPEPDQPAVPHDGRALCLSGGGYRAMLFHLGALYRLRELGFLADLKRVSSVSGGSIVAAQLALKWSLGVAGDNAEGFQSEVVAPIRHLAGITIDWRAILLGLLLPGSISDRIAGYYRRHLYGNASLQDLPPDSQGPRFVINATNVQSGALWRFSRPFMRDWRVGEVRNSALPLAKAVAASSGFPPILSPAVLKLKPADFTPNSGADLQREPYTSRVVLTDGGVYDNLGLETAWKLWRTILVSDGGGQMPAEPNPPTDWLLGTKRVLDLVDNQVRALRKRQVISGFQLPRNPADPVWRSGTYWGIRTNIADYGLADPLDCPFDKTMALAEIPTRLARLPSVVQERLINWGYAVCDAAMRRWVIPEAERPAGFPYPSAGVG